MKKAVTVLGGDARQRFLARALTEKGCLVSCHAVPGVPDTRKQAADSLRHSDMVVLPLPAFDAARIRGTDLPAKEILSQLRPGTLICGGKLGGVPLPEGCPVFDYGADEALAALNAVPTAEAAIALALEKMTCTLWESRTLIIGCGRIGRALAQRLSALGSRVSVSSRKAGDAAWCRSVGCIPEKTGDYRQPLSVYRCIFNTVPAPVFTAEQLAQVRPDCPLLDLASLPGGLPKDCDAPKAYCPALGLPGKYFPETAALLICDAITDRLHALEVCHV